jgi:hypothetical protein
MNSLQWAKTLFYLRQSLTLIRKRLSRDKLGADFKTVMWGKHVHLREAQAEQHLSVRRSGKCRYLLPGVTEFDLYLSISPGS